MSNEEKYPGFSDHKKFCDVYDTDVKFLNSDAPDDYILELSNSLPRQIAYMQCLLETVTTRIETILEPAPTVSLEERTDDWLAERRDQIKVEISRLKREDEAFKAERDAIDAEFTRRFEERGTSGTRAARFTVSLKEDDNYPQMSDRTAFEDYVLSTGNLHLLQKRLSLSSVTEEHAALGELRDVYLNSLKEAGEDYNALVSLYNELCEEAAITQKVADADDLVNNKSSIEDLRNFLEDEIKRVFHIPGIEIVTKRSINQVKRKA